MSKQQFSIVPVRWNATPKSGLASDFDPKNMRDGGLYVTTAETGGFNIRSVGKGTNVGTDVEPIYGNTYQFTPDTAATQNKLFQITVDISAVTVGNIPQFHIVLSSISGNQFVYYDATITVSDIATALSDIDTIIQAQFSAYSPVTSTAVTGSFTGTIDVEFTAAPNFNYVLTTVVDTDLLVLTTAVTQESVDISMLGDWNLIGSNDRIGDAFIFSTTRKGLPEEFAILNITNPSGSVVQVETVEDHGFVDGQAVRIESVQGVTEANGEWIIANVTATTFELLLCVFIGPSYIGGTGVAITNIYGLGEIGVAVEDNQGVITYTRLLRSNEFNFSTLKQIDARCKRKQDAKIATYFVDNLNQYRVFYYKGAYTTDGAITGANAQYAYGSISIDLQLFISNEGFGIAYSSQIQTGGTVKSGNWRYAVSFLTTELVRSEWSQLTDTVSVFSTSTIFPSFVLGDEENIVTPKQNILTVSNAIPGLYDFCEIAAINYIGTSMTGVIIGRYSLNGSLTQDIVHTGSENNVTDLDIGTLNAILPGISTGRNVELLDNRLVISNLTPSQTRDFTSWVETFAYSLEREGLDPIGVWDTTYANLRIGEYQLPDNIYSKKSHMIYETYRYGFRFRLKGSGALTNVFYPGYDIKIDLPATLPPERIPGSFNSFDLTNLTETEVYTIYINWLNINLGFIIDGVPVYNLISEIIPCRVDVIPEVLASGAAILGVSGENHFPAFGGVYGITLSLPAGGIGPFPYISGFTDGVNPTPVVIGTNPTYPAQTIGTPYEDPERDSVFFFSPDISWNQTSITRRIGDQIISFGAPTRHDEYSTIVAGTTLQINYAEYSGYSNITANPTASDIDDASFMTLGQEALLLNSKNYSLQYMTLTPTIIYGVDQCVVCSMASSLANTGVNTDYGFYMGLYYRPLVNKYGDPNTTIYTEFGVPYSIGSNIGVISSGEITSYGDVFTQKTYLKFRNPGITLANIPSGTGFGVGVAYYSQNRANLQLKRKPTPTYSSALIPPEYPIDNWLSLASGTANAPYVLKRDVQFFYNKGYTPRNTVTSAVGFDSNAIYQIDWGNAIMWSNSEVDGSNTDFNRIFPPLNIKFLDYTFGAIMGAMNINGQLITVQPSRTMRQYFNTTELITSEIGSEVILGDGGVMRREGQVITQFGSQHKWSILVGKSDKGFDVLYFVDVINKTVCRYGYNGNDAIDEINGMKAFFANNLQWVIGKDTPAHEEGIHGVANQRYREILFTFRGHKDVGAWVRDEVSGNLITGWLITYGNELIVNPSFAGPISTVSVQIDGNCAGWQQLGANPPITWYWSPPQPTSGYFLPHAFKSFVTGTGDYLQQITPLQFVAGTTYLIQIIVYVTGSPIQVRFQIPSAAIYTISTPGTHYFTYTASGGDDNIYLYGPAAATQRIPLVSIKEIISIGGWLGAPTWTFGNYGATANGTDADNLVDDDPDYIVPGYNYELTYFIDYNTSGAVQAFIGDFADTVNGPITASGTYTFSGASTTNGVVSFVPTGGFDGTVVNQFRLISDNPKNYFIGDHASVPGTTTFEEFDDIYIALNDNSNSYPTTVNPDWQLIPHTNPDFYNEYTITFAEMKDAFQSFVSIKPRIYAKFLNKYLVPRPKSDTGRIYLSDSGIPTKWFDGPDGSQSDVAFLDAIINSPTGRKRFTNVRVESDIAPWRMEVETTSQVSFTPNAMFHQNPTGEFDAPVMNDSTVTGVSDGDTSTMYGDWMRVRLIIQKATYNKINSFVMKVRVLARQFFK